MDVIRKINKYLNESYGSSRDELMDVYDPEQVADMIIEVYKDFEGSDKKKFDSAVEKITKKTPKNEDDLRKMIENMKEKDALKLLDLSDELM